MAVLYAAASGLHLGGFTNAHDKVDELGFPSSHTPPAADSALAVAAPVIEIAPAAGGGMRVQLGGDWTALGLTEGARRPGFASALRRAVALDASWDLCGMRRFDEIGARWLLHHWSGKLPPRLALDDTQREVLDGAVRTTPAPATATARRPWHATLLEPVARLGEMQFAFVHHLVDATALLGQLVFDLGRFARRPLLGPWREISANIYQIGFRALAITALVGFLIGIVLSYLTAQQLLRFGSGGFIVNILGIAVIRELGPLLAAILIAGRSGSAITAQIGVMRVTEELDAMQVLGLPHGFRLVLPKVIALAIAMPLLVLWTDLLALAGGMLAASLQLDVSAEFFIHQLPHAVRVSNLWIGLGKGAVFGMLIALTACHFGLRIAPNTRSLGEGTTSSVVTAITLVILADAIFAIVFREVGL